MTRTHATRARWVEAVLVAAVAIMATLAAWVRLPPVTQGTVWAEDGVLFLNDAISGSAPQHLFAGYAGYLQLVPRALADGTVAFAQIEHFGLVLNFASCFVAGLCAALVYWCARDVVGPRALRLILAAITVGAPLLPIEVLGNAANVHWLFIWTMLWVLLYRPRTWAGSSLLGLVALIFALSEIQLVIFVPIFLLNRRVALVWLPRIGLLMGLFAQIVTSLLSPRVSQSGGLAGAVRAFIGQTVLASFFPDEAVLNDILGHFAVLWETVAIAPFAFALVYVLRRGLPLQRIAILYLVPGSVVLWTTATYLNGYGGAPLTTYQGFSFVRYAVVPSLFLLASLVVLAQVLLSRRISEGRMGMLPGALPAVAVIALLIVHFVPYDTTRSRGPEWQAAIERAQTDCGSAPPRASEPITTAPRYKGVHWVFDVSCTDLRE